MTASEQAQDRVPVKGTRIAGKYRIEREIGRGGMGIVFEASHLVTGKHFAVKWLLPELAASSSALERFVSARARRRPPDHGVTRTELTRCLQQAV